MTPTKNETCDCYYLQDHGDQLYSNRNHGPISAKSSPQQVPQDFPYIIQKFGGTSLGKYSPNIVNNVIIPHAGRHKIIAVCSARSLDSKVCGTTNRLLRVAHDVYRPSSGFAEKVMCDIEAEHVEAIQGFIKCPKIARDVIGSIRTYCRHATALLLAARTLGELTTNCLETIVSIGEKLSAIVLCAMLQDQGIRADYIDLSKSIVFKEKGISRQEIYDEFSRRLAARVRACNAQVVVVTGYFGQLPGGLLSSVGRGYTDLCAVLLAAGIPGSELQVWKELDGIFTADPRMVRTARLVDTLSPAEAAELTLYGSEVIHSSAMEQAVRREVTIAVKGVMNPEGHGSLVISTETADAFTIPTPHKPLSGPRLPQRNEDATASVICISGRPVALTTKAEITVLRVRSTEHCPPHTFLTTVLATLAKWRLSFDLMSTSGEQVSVALFSKAKYVLGDADDINDVADADLHGAIQELQPYGSVELVPRTAIISVIGLYIWRIPNLAGRIFTTLGVNNIQTLMICQGVSDISISCVISESQVERAICILHDCLIAPSAIETVMSLPFIDPLVRPSKTDQKRARKREAQRKYRHRLRQRSEGGEENCDGSVNSDTIVIPERDGSGNEAQELGQTPIGDFPLSSYVDGPEARGHFPAVVEVGFPPGGDTSPAVSIPHFDHYQSPPLTSDHLWPALVSGSGDDAGEGDELLRMFGNLTNIAEGAPKHVPSQGDYHHFTTTNTTQSDMLVRQPEKSQWNGPQSQAAQPSFQDLGRRSSGPFIDGSPFTQRSNKGTKKLSTNDAALCVARTMDANVDSKRSADSIISNVSSMAGRKEGHATTITNTGPTVQRIGVEKEQRGYTPLFQAVAQGQVKMVKILMRKCNNINATDEMGETMLHLAAKRGNQTIVDFLLESGVNLDVCDHGGNTALHLAVANGHEDIVEMLVEAGADTDIVSRPRR
ncbi:hypothetical protein FHL15_009932 [Xylaria flabelliformis]|uniref:aspartate kinase n=1 Tax=Xylaria flabelliformis TaxID=2512241 RepID=A0A553HMQ0_9PEZI|nr:hypothetical protein FHL15_009932 [Xylaria flabelliformis]